MNYGEYKQSFLERFVNQNTFKRAKQIRVKNTERCPDCNCELEEDITHCETYCPSCGLITAASIDYVGLRKVKYKYE